MNSKIIKVLFLLILGFSVTNLTVAEEKNKEEKNFSKITGSPSRTTLNINNISTQMVNNGESDLKSDGNSGFIFPKGTGKGAVFESGLVWGAFVPGDDTVRVGGSTYRHGLQPGRVLPSGIAEDPEGPNVRIFRVRPDIFPGGPSVDLSFEAIDEGKSESAIRAQYELDWNEWPADIGAPYDDVDNDGTYNPANDIPGVPGSDQTVWFVANDFDEDNTKFLHGAKPLGLEMQATFWAYAQTGALGNMYFRKYRLINKSNVDFSDMIVSMWSDVDLGNSSDDFAGCDTLLSLGYCYNGNATDATYNPLPPPAVGFDFFQGPILDGVAGQDLNKNGIDDAEDQAIFDGKIVQGSINLPMTAFYYFARGDANVTDPTLGAREGSIQFYNFMQGKVGKTGDPFQDPNTGQITKFALAGDPQTGTGWVDGQLLPAGDRRIGQAAGPFTMAVGDTQEVVVAQIAAGAIPGVSRLDAIGLLKFYDLEAQKAYDDFFDLATPPPAPITSVVELDQEIVLEWGGATNRVMETENFNEKGYTFQGYNVYQLPSRTADISQAKRLATFDIQDGVLKVPDLVFDVSIGSVIEKPVQFGNDTGIKRFFRITGDEFNGGTPLINGIRYYFAVTAYSYNEDPSVVPRSKENPISVITVVPHSNDPGIVYEHAYLDTLPGVNHSSGLSDGNVFPIVIDPTQLNGATYTVTFDTTNDGSQTIFWSVDRNLNGTVETVISQSFNQNADEESPIVDGIQFRVIGAPNDFKNFEVVANANGPLNPAEGGALDFGGFPSLRPTAAQQVGDGLWGFHTADNGGTNDGGTRGDYESFKARTTRDGSHWSELIPYDFEMRFTGSNDNPGVGGGYAYEAFNDGNVFWVPFELWNIGINTPNDPSDDYRLVPWIIDDAGLNNEGDDIYALESWGSSAAGSGDLEHSVSSADNDPFTDWVYWTRPSDHSPGEAGYNAAEALMLAGTYAGDNETEIFARTVLVNWNGGSAPPFTQDVPEQGTIFRIYTTKPNAPGVDVFTFTAPNAPTPDAELAKEDIKKINVFPNPYYAVNSEEINKYNRFVTFSHLPNSSKTTIRIFNLAGVHIRTIEKEPGDQFQRWDLANENGLPVASGLYIAYIDMPELGESKILKFSIIQEQQILDRF